MMAGHGMSMHSQTGKGRLSHRMFLLGVGKMLHVVSRPQGESKGIPPQEILGAGLRLPIWCVLHCIPV